MWSYSHAATAKLQPPRTRIQWCPCTCIGRACNTHRPAQCVMARLRHTKSVQAALRPGNIRAACVVAAAARLVAGNVAEGTAAAGCVENTAPLPTRLRDTPPVAQNSGRTSVLLCRPLCRGRHAAAVATLYNVCHIHTQKHTHTHTHTHRHTHRHTQARRRTSSRGWQTPCTHCTQSCDQRRIAASTDTAPRRGSTNSGPHPRRHRCRHRLGTT